MKNTNEKYMDNLLGVTKTSNDTPDFRKWCNNKIRFLI